MQLLCCGVVCLAVIIVSRYVSGGVAVPEAFWLVQACNGFPAHSGLASFSSNSKQQWGHSIRCAVLFELYTCQYTRAEYGNSCPILFFQNNCCAWRKTAFGPQFFLFRASLLQLVACKWQAEKKNVCTVARVKRTDKYIECCFVRSRPWRCRIRIILLRLVVSDLSPDLQIVFKPNKEKQQCRGRCQKVRQQMALCPTCNPQQFLFLCETLVSFTMFIFVLKVSKVNKK